MFKKENIGSLFDGISNHYDRFNALSSMGIDHCWRRQAVKQLPENCEKLLDVATGTADLAITAMKKKRAKSIIGVDLSEGMMAVGREKVAKHGMSDSIVLQQANCEALPFEDATFDAIICGYGVRNFANLEGSLAEMSRVLKPNGKVLIMEFSYPTNWFIRGIYNFYFSHILPLIGKLVVKDGSAMKYFVNSVKQFAKGDAFVAYLKKAGFVDTTYKNQTFGISVMYSGWKR